MAITTIAAQPTESTTSDVSAEPTPPVEAPVEETGTEAPVVGPELPPESGAEGAEAAAGGEASAEINVDGDTIKSDSTDSFAQDWSDARRYRMGIGVGLFDGRNLNNGDGVAGHRGSGFEVEAGFNFGLPKLPRLFVPLSARYSFDQVSRDLAPGKSQLRSHNFQLGSGIGIRAHEDHAWISFMAFLGGVAHRGQCNAGSETVQVLDTSGNPTTQEVDVDCDGESGVLANNNAKTVTLKTGGFAFTPEIAVATLHGSLELALQIPLSFGGKIPFAGGGESPSNEQQPFNVRGVGLRVKVFPGGIIHAIKNRKNKNRNSGAKENSSVETPPNPMNDAAKTESTVSLEAVASSVNASNLEMSNAYYAMMQEIDGPLTENAKKPVKKFEGKDKKEKQANKNEAVKASMDKIIELAKSIAVSYGSVQGEILTLEDGVNEMGPEEKQAAIAGMKDKKLFTQLTEVQPVAEERDEKGNLKKRTYPESPYDIAKASYDQIKALENLYEDAYRSKNKGAPEIDFPEISEPQPYQSDLVTE